MADQTEKETINKRNQISSLLENTRKGMVEFGKQLPSEQHARITETLAKAEKELNDADLEKLDELLKEVGVAAKELTESLMALA